jgi:hypothetical protein
MQIHRSGIVGAWASCGTTTCGSVLTAAPEDDPMLLAGHPGQLIIADKGYVSAELERPTRPRTARRPHH